MLFYRVAVGAPGRRSLLGELVRLLCMTLARKPAATSELPACCRKGRFPSLSPGDSACFSSASRFACTCHTFNISDATAERVALCRMWSSDSSFIFSSVLLHM
jgi:hypothetical protein